MASNRYSDRAEIINILRLEPWPTNHRIMGSNPCGGIFINQAQTLEGVCFWSRVPTEGTGHTREEQPDDNRPPASRMSGGKNDTVQIHKAVFSEFQNKTGGPIFLHKLADS